jgi:anti-sigma regulatory factor (Ser/Thr protein kinase)/ABC-type transporter Mla MlaB component
MAAEQLVCQLEHAPPVASVSVRGRLDPQTVPVLRNAVLKALTAEPTAVLIDLSGVTGVDPIALTVFLSLARAAAAWPGAQLVSHSAAAPLADSIEELAIGRHVPLVADRAAAEALAARQGGPVQVRWEVAGDADGLAESRGVVRTFCRGHGLAAVAGDAELLITELVVNAIVHGAAPITARAAVLRRYLHLAVGDRAAAMPRLVGPHEQDGEGGRGLMIVEALTIAWGATPRRDGKVVWCTLRP